MRSVWVCTEVTERRSKHWDPLQGRTVDDFVYDAKFLPAGKSPANLQFWAGSPSGEVLVRSTRANLFVPGRRYTFSIEQAE